jgi:glycosyltransferase involved in cell wall biosynthesis
MKIAFLIGHMKSGGAERAVSNLSLAMQDEHDVSVILFDATDIGYPHGGGIINLGIYPTISKLGKIINILKRAFKLRKIYKKHNFDGIFTFMEGPGFPSVLASKETIVSVHDNPKSLDKIYMPFYPYIYPRAKKVVTCAKAIEEKLINAYGFTNTTTIYNSVDIEHAIKQSSDDIEETRPFLLSVGRLAPQKGFDFLIEAFAASEAQKDVDLLICGEGDERERLQALIDEKGMTGKIILKGNIDNPFAYYAKAEFFVLSSRHEGFPNILIEALACECPCVSFDCDTGPNEIIKADENGLLVEAENVPALTTAIDKLHADKELQTLFKKNARSSVAHLSPKAIAKEWLDLI